MEESKVLTHRIKNLAITETALKELGGDDTPERRAYATRRLAEGAAKYGELRFKERDCAKEAAEEGIDGANWAAFEALKTDLDHDAEELLQLAIVNFTEAYEVLQEYIRWRDGH